MTSMIFISYRREDSAPYAGRLYDRLARDFGEDQVFMDIDAIEPGEDFVEVINQRIASCRAVVALIGRGWLTCADEAGARRLDKPDDYVRLELSMALKRKVRLVPVLVGGAAMPRINGLPEDLAPLCRRNAIEISDTRFHQDVDRLVEALRKTVAPAQARAVPAAAHESADELYERGVAFYYGKDVARDYAQAAHWYRKAAEQGHAAAQYLLGVMYDEGRGVAADGEQAVSWYREAAAQGNANAQEELSRRGLS